LLEPVRGGGDRFPIHPNILFDRTERLDQFSGCS
jgi:hypothetical protein